MTTAPQEPTHTLIKWNDQLEIKAPGNLTLADMIAFTRSALDEIETVNNLTCERPEPPASSVESFRDRLASVLAAAGEHAVIRGIRSFGPYYDPNPEPLPSPDKEPDRGMKYDAGKPISGALYQDFTRALMAVADISTFGAVKYERSSWKSVPDAMQRYNDALHRHLLAANLTPYDCESGQLHLAHAAWNLLAVLELTIGAGIEGARVTSARQEP